MKTFKPVGTWVLVDIVETSKLALKLTDGSMVNKSYVVSAIGEAVKKQLKAGDNIFAVGKVFSLDEIPELQKGQGLIMEEAILGVIE